MSENVGFKLQRIKFYSRREIIFGFKIFLLDIWGSGHPNARNGKVLAGQAEHNC